MRLIYLVSYLLMVGSVEGQTFSFDGSTFDLAPVEQVEQPQPQPPAPAPTPRPVQVVAPIKPQPLADREPQRQGVCACHGDGRNEGVCYCLRAGQKCGCAAHKGSVWNLTESDKPVGKTGQYLQFSTKPSSPVQPAKPAVRNPRTILLTAKWCGPCRALVADAFPWLLKDKSNGWTIGPEPTNAIQVIDIDEHPEAWSRYATDSRDALPLALCVEDEKVVRRMVNPDRWGLVWVALGVRR